MTKVDHSATHTNEMHVEDSSKDTLSKGKPVAGDNCRHPVCNMSAGSEDNQGFDDSSDDEPVGLCDSSTDEELMNLSDSDGDDIVNFVDWRKDGWASLRVGSRGEGDKKLRRRKIRPHLLPELLAQRDRRKREKENESAEMKMHEDKIAKTAEVKEDSISVKPNTLKTTLKPTPLEASALELTRVNQELIEELRIREAARTSPVPPIGSTVSWLSGTDDGSRAGGVNQQDARGNLSEPKPRSIPLYGTHSGQNGIGTLIAKKPSSAISVVQSPEDRDHGRQRRL